MLKRMIWRYDGLVCCCWLEASSSLMLGTNWWRIRPFLMVFSEFMSEARSIDSVEYSQPSTVNDVKWPRLRCCCRCTCGASKVRRCTAAVYQAKTSARCRASSALLVVAGVTLGTDICKISKHAHRCSTSFCLVLPIITPRWSFSSSETMRYVRI